MFLIAPTAVAAITAIPSLVKGVTGISQLIKGSQLGKTPRPKYVRPGEIDQLVESARTRAAGVGLPGQSEAMEEMESDIANMLRQAQKTGSPADFMTTVSELASQKSQRVRELTVAAAKDYQLRQDRLASALQIGAEETRREFDINLYQPYLAAQAASSALRQAGATNIFGAIGGITEAAIGGIDLSNVLGGTGAGGTDLSLENIPFR